MDQLFERQKLLKLIQETDHLKRLTPIKEIKLLGKTLPIYSRPRWLC